MNGFLDILEKLKNINQAKLIITSAVKYEVVDRPLGVQRFELGALRVQNLLYRNIIELPESLEIQDQQIKETTKEFLESANHILQVHGQWVPIVSEAEMSCLALAKILQEKQNTDTLIAIDERTTRIICESPQTLEKLMSERLHQRVNLVEENLGMFKNYRFIRSSELIYVAHKKGVLGIEGKKALEAALYATKYKGAAISFEEIDVIKKL